MSDNTTDAPLPAARLLVVENESHHTIYGLGNECADGYVDGYLLTGELPPPGATCEGLPLPSPPAADQLARSLRAGEIAGREAFLRHVREHGRLARSAARYPPTRFL